MHVTVALLAIVRGVWACAEPTLMAQSLYDSSTGAALYNGGFACAYSGAQASAGEYMCLLSPNGNTLDLIGASQPSHAPPFQCCANDPVSNLALCLGGLTTDSRLFRFNLTSRLWLDAIDIPPVLALRSGHSCTVSKGNLFVVGGLSSKGDVASPTMFSISLEAYAVRTDYSAPPSAARVGHVTVTLPSDDILVLFGSTSPPAVAQLPTLIFSLENGSWSEYSSKAANSPDLFPRTLDGASCTAWSSTASPDGGVFCYGGRDVAASNPIPYLTYLNLSSATWSNLGSPPTSSGQYSGTFGSSVSLLNGGSVVVVKSGGSALSTNVYTSANVAKNFACSSGDANDGFGNFYGVPPLGPGTCGIEGKPQCPSASSLGATNISAVGSGWITPAPGVGFPVVTPIMKTAVATAVPSKTDINIKTSSVVSNQGDKDVNGSDGSGLSGARLGLAIGIPILILLLCCVGGFVYGKNKASRADMKKRSEVPARAPLPGNSVDIGMAALPPTDKMDSSGQGPTYVAPPTTDTYNSILDQNQSPGDITNSHGGETFAKSAVLGASSFAALASTTKQKFAGVQKNDGSINLVDDSPSSAAIQSETLVGASVATAISMQNEKHTPSAEMGATTLFAVGAGEEVSFESDAGHLVHVPLGGKSAIDDVQASVGITPPVSDEALYSSRPTEVENVFTAPVVALAAAAAGASAIAQTRRKSDAATRGPAIPENSVKPLSKPENRDAPASTLPFFGSFFRGPSADQPSTSESLSRDAVVASSESALTPADITMPSTLEETFTPIDQNGLNTAEEEFLPPLVSSFPLEAAVNEDSHRESDVALDSAEGNPTYFTPIPEPVASAADVENPNMISVHESTPREIPSVSELFAEEKIHISPLVALSASSIRPLASNSESSNKKDVDEIVTLPQSTQGASASTSKRSFFGSFFKSATNDESEPPTNQLSKDVSVLPGVSESMTVNPATNERPSPVAVTGTTYLSDVGVEGASTDLENVAKDVVSPELSARVPLTSSLKPGAASFITTNADDFNRVGSNVTVVKETMNAPATAAPSTGNNVSVASSQMERAIPSNTNLEQDSDNTDALMGSQDGLQPEMVELRAVAPSESDAPIVHVAAALPSSNEFGPPVEISAVEVVPTSDMETHSEKPGSSLNKGVSKMATVVPVLLDSQKPSKKPVFKLFKSKKAVLPASTDTAAADATNVSAAFGENSSELRSSKMTDGPVKTSILNDPELSAGVPLGSSLKQNAPIGITTNDDFSLSKSSVTVVEETMNANGAASTITGDNAPVAISQMERAIPSNTNLQQDLDNTDALMGSQDGLQPEMVELRAVAPSESDAPIVHVAAALPSSNEFGPPVEISAVEVVPASDMETHSEKPGSSLNKGVSKMATVVPVLLDSQKPSKKPVFKLFKSMKAVSPASTEPVAADATIVPAALPEHSSELRSSKLTAGPAKMPILDDEIPAVSSSLAVQSHERALEGITSIAATPAAFIHKNDIKIVDSWQSKSDEKKIANVGGVTLNESGYEMKDTDQGEHNASKEAEEKSKRLVVGHSEGGKDYQTSFAGSKAINLAAPEDKLSETSTAAASRELETATAASSKILEANLAQFSVEKRFDESLPGPAVDTSAIAPVSSQNRGELVSIGRRPAPNTDGHQENATSNSGNLIATSISTDSKKAPKKPVFKLFKSKKPVLPAETVESNERTLDGVASIAATPATFIDKNDIRSSLQADSADEANAIATVGGVALNESGYGVKQTDQDEHDLAKKAEETSRRVVVGQNGGGKEDYQIEPNAAKLSETSPSVTTSELEATTAASSEIVEENPLQLADEKQSDESFSGPAVGRSDTASVSSQNRDLSGELVSIGTRPTPNSDGPQENAISNSGNVAAAPLSVDSKKPPKKALFKMFKSKKADAPTSAGKLNSDVDPKAVVVLPLNGRSQDGQDLLAVIEEPTNGIPLDHEIVAISARPVFEPEVRGTDTRDAETDSSVVDRAMTIDDALLSGANRLSTAKANTGVMSTDTKAADVAASGTSAENVGDPQMMPVELSKIVEMATPAHSTIPVVDFAASLNVASVPVTSSEFINSEIDNHEPASGVTVIEEDVISTTLNHADTSIIQQAGITTTKIFRYSSQTASAPSASAITSGDMSDWTIASPEIRSSTKIPALSEAVNIDSVDEEVNAVVIKESELLIPVESTHLIDNLGVDTTSSTELSTESSDSYIHLSSRVTVIAEAINTAKDTSLPEGMPNVPHIENLSIADGASHDLSRAEKPVTKVDNEPRSPVDSSDFAVTKTQSNSPVTSKPRSFFGRILSSVSGTTSSDALNGPLETIAVTSAGISPVQEQSPSENKTSAACEGNARTSDKIDSNARSSTVVVMEEENEGVLHSNDAAGSVMASNILKDVSVASSDIESASMNPSVKTAMSEKVEVSQEVDIPAQNTLSSANVAPITKDETVTRSLEEAYPKTASLDVATAPGTVSLDESRSENASFASDGQKSSNAESHTSGMLATNRELPKTATDAAFAMQGAVPESKPAKKPIVKLVKVSKSEPKKSLVQVMPETDIGRRTDPSSSMTANESLLDDKKQESERIVSKADEELVNVQVVPQNTADSSSTLAATGAQIKIAKKPIVKMVKATRVERKEETGEHSSIATSDAPLPDNVQEDSAAVPAQVPKGSILASSKSDDVLPSTIIDVAGSERKVSVLEGVVPVTPEVSHESAPVAPKKVARKIVIAKRKVDTPVISPQLRVAEFESSPSQDFSVENTTASNESALTDKANDIPEETMKFSDSITTAVGAASPDGVSEASVSVLIPEPGSTGPIAQKELDALTGVEVRSPTVTSPISKADGPQIPVPFEFIAVPAYTTRVRSDSVGPQSIDGFDSEIDDRSDAGSAAAESNADSDVTNDGVYFSPRRNTSVSLASELVLGGKRSSIIVRATPTTDLVRSPSRTSLQRPRNSFVYEMTRPGSRTASSSDIRKEARHRLSTVSTPSRRASAAISIATIPGVDSVPFGKNAESTAIDSEDVIVLQKRASMSSLSGRSVDSTGKRKSFLESLNDVSSIVSSVSPRRVTSPTDTISAMKLVDTYSSTVSQGWWTRFTEATKALFSGFDGYEFLTRNSEIDGDRSDDVLMAVFAASGAPVDETEIARCMDQLNASPDLAREFLGELGSVVQTTSPRHFYYNILPIWNANDLAPAMTLKDGLAKMAEAYPEFKPDLFGFIAEAKKISPPFSVSKFLEAFSTVQGDMSEEKIVSCFKYSGADATAEDCKKLLALFSGLWSYDGLRDFSQIVRRVGVPTFLSGYREVSKPTVEQSRPSAMAWISSISDMGPKVRFDPLSFQNGCRAINPVFTMNTFLVNLAEEEEFLGDVTIRKTLSMSGLDLTDEEFEEVMVLSCGDFESRFDVFCGWWQFIRLWGVDSYFASVEGILAEQRSKNALVMTFLSRIHGLGEDVQFNLRGFVASCKKQNADFSLQQFCENVRSIPRLESDSLHEAFVQSGIDLDPDSVEYKNLLETLFGDEALAMAAMREWHYILKRLGSEWSVLYMYALVEQHERVQNSVQDFKSEIQAIPVMIDGKPSQVRFTLRSFVEKCKSLKSEWNSDAAADFDLKALLEKLTHISDHGNTVDTLISAFKSVGIYTTDKEYELLIGSIAGGDYLSSLVVFQMLIVFLKKWGMEWNMWIIWSLLDDKEHDDDVLTRFVLHVHTFDPKAKFDLVKFVERCGTLENSWQAESSFDLEKFMTGLLAVEGKISLEAVEPVFRSCGIRTTLDEYSDLITTLTGGDFDDIAASVLAYWISLVKLWGVQWFMRCGPSFFERFNNAQAAADKLDTALTITDNRLDVRTFEWYCQIKNGGFSLPNFLDALVQSAGKNSSSGNDFMTEDMLLLLLSEQRVELSNEELTNLVGVLTGADGNDGMHIIWEWVLLLRAISVRYFMLAYQVESMWASVNVDTGLAIKAFHSRASYRCERFSVERFLTSAQGLKEDWDVELFFNYLVEIHGDVSLLHIQQAFKATDVDVTSDQAMDLLTSLTGDEEHALSVAQDWISTAWVVGIRTLLEAENAIQVEKVPEESGGWFFSRVIQAAESAARAVGGV